jgi:uncharacterized protein YjiS (DUF1127 family)
MQDILHFARFARRREQRPGGRFRSVLAQWRQRRQERNQLARMSDRELADIGVTRVEQWRECEKPVWRP